MSKIFFSDKELEIFDAGYRAGMNAALEEVIKQFPLVEEKYYDIFDKLVEYIRRDWSDKEIEDETPEET